MQKLISKGFDFMFGLILCKQMIKNHWQKFDMRKKHKKQENNELCVDLMRI